MLNWIMFSIALLASIFFICEVIVYKKKQKELYITEKEQIIKQINDELVGLRNTNTSLKEEIENNRRAIRKDLDEQKLVIENYITTEKHKRQLELESEMTKLQNELFAKRVKLVQEYTQTEIELTNKIADFEARQEAINEAIQREKRIREQEDFYKIQISDNNKEDIQFLKKVSQELHNKEILQKLIYNTYMARPVQEMEKRVLGGEKKSGIYKITYLKTGEAYIGKSVDVAGRWIEHIKSSLGIGTIAHSSFHVRLEEDGIWNYSWELLEEVPKDKLTEREKYYINLYGTDKIGLNMKVG